MLGTSVAGSLSSIRSTSQNQRETGTGSPGYQLSPLAASGGECQAQTNSWSRHMCIGTKARPYVGWREKQRPVGALPSDPRGAHTGGCDRCPHLSW